MDITTAKAEFGKSYNVGWVGFIHHIHPNFVSAGIEWFTRWSREGGDIEVSHTFIITGDGTTCEAFADGVNPGRLENYLTDKTVGVFVREPGAWTPESGQKIAAAALAHDGEHYDFADIAALAGVNTLMGHLINKATDGKLERLLTSMAAGKSDDICSSLVTKALQASKTPLSALLIGNDPYEVSPQDLFSSIDGTFKDGATLLTL